jgi:hypothetical protein
MPRASTHLLTRSCIYNSHLSARCMQGRSSIAIIRRSMAVFFGTTGNYRFDDPVCGSPSVERKGGCFGVLYAGADPECCLLESRGPTTGVPTVSGAYLDARSIARLELMEGLRFVDLVEPGGDYMFLLDLAALVRSPPASSREARWDTLQVSTHP